MPKGNPGVPRKNLRDRLLPKFECITESGCWIWMGKLRRRIDDSERYGVINIRGKEEYVHRVMFKLFRGPIPRGRKVCHKCDIRCCGNPDHLYSATQKRNLLDAVSRDRMGRKFSVDTVRQIRSRLEAGEAATEIAREFGVSASAVYKIKYRTVWTEI